MNGEGACEDDPTKESERPHHYSWAISCPNLKYLSSNKNSRIMKSVNYYNYIIRRNSKKVMMPSLYIDALGEEQVEIIPQGRESVGSKL